MSCFDSRRLLSVLIVSLVVTGLLAGCSEGDPYQKGKEAAAAGNMEKACEYYEQAAEKGSVPAILALVAEGKISDSTIEKYWEGAKPTASDQYALGELYRYGIGVSKNANKALSYYLNAANDGMVKAMTAVGELYALSSNNGIVGDEEESFKWWLKAAELGDAFSQYMVGSIIQIRAKTDRDVETVVEWYKKAADQGYPAALHELGNMYTSGYGVPLDLKKAIVMFEKAAAQGDRKSSVELGDRYMKGVGVSQSAEKAFEYYSDAAKAGYSDSMFKLGAIFEYGIGKPVDINMAFQLYSSSAQKGNMAALSKVGDMYLLGKGVSKDYKKAKDFYISAGRQGEYKLAFVYDDLNGIKPALLNSIAEKTNLAVAGDTNAMVWLGNEYSNSKFYPEDYAEAFKWYREAALQGNREAQRELGMMYLKGEGVLYDYEKALSLLSKAANQNDARAQRELGDMYSRAVGVDRNIALAKQWYKKAAEQGDIVARALLRTLE